LADFFAEVFLLAEAFFVDFFFAEDFLADFLAVDFFADFLLAAGMVHLLSHTSLRRPCASVAGAPVRSSRPTPRIARRDEGHS
jgi:hypothetical protein